MLMPIGIFLLLLALLILLNIQFFFFLRNRRRSKDLEHRLDYNLRKLSLARNCNIGEKIRSIFSLFGAEAELKGIGVQMLGLDNPIYISLDEDKFESILYNLLSNSLKYIPEDGEIWISLGTAEREQLSSQMKAREDDKCSNYAIVTVINTGISLDKKALEEYFGLLYHARELASLHKGYFWASSAENNAGLELRLALPLTDVNYSESDFMPQAILLNGADKDFYERLYNIIRENISDSDLSVSRICERLNVSRSKLYTKVNSLTGMSPKHLLLDYRLKMAVKLLEEGNMNVSEVSDACGFNSLSYFSKAFKKRYHRLPSDFKVKHQ